MSEATQTLAAINDIIQRYQDAANAALTQHNDTIASLVASTAGDIIKQATTELIGQIVLLTKSPELSALKLNDMQQLFELPFNNASITSQIIIFPQFTEKLSALINERLNLGNA
jgi:hypothetical protein